MVAAIVLIALVGVGASVWEAVAKTRRRLLDDPNGGAANALLHLLVSAVASLPILLVFSILVYPHLKVAFCVIWTVVWLTTRPLWLGAQGKG